MTIRTEYEMFKYNLHKTHLSANQLASLFHMQLSWKTKQAMTQVPMINKNNPPWNTLDRILRTVIEYKLHFNDSCWTCIFT